MDCVGISASSAGRNEVDFFIRNTVNASLGPATPTYFDPGAYIQLENMYNLDFGYSPTDNTNIGFGVESRSETFEVRVGQQESFDIGSLAPQGFSAASNGFPGFSNLAGGQFTRRNVAAYIDGEWEPTDRLLLGAAIRFEDFDDFGTTTNGKIAANWRIVRITSDVRATYGTGFKAPTPGQSNAFNVSTEFDFTINDLVNNGTVPSTTAVAALRGGKALAPEDSTNYTAGVFFNLGNLDVTVDYFNIEIEDRLNLSQNYSVDATGNRRPDRGWRDGCRKPAKLPLLHERFRHGNRWYRRCCYLSDGLVSRYNNAEPGVQSNEHRR